MTRDWRLRLKPAIVQDTDYKIEKTYHTAPYLGAFGAYMFQNMFPYTITMLERGGQLMLSSIIFSQKQPRKTIWLRKLTIQHNT